MRVSNSRKSRSGNVLVLTVLMMVVMFAAIAYAVDLGYLCVVRSQLQRTADATALATAWELCDGASLDEAADPLYAVNSARATASQYASLNSVAGEAPELASSDLQLGYLQADGQTISANPTAYVAASVNVRREEGQNGTVPLFFSGILGINDSSKSSQATAVFLNSIGGFKPPTSGENLGMLPISVDEETWNARNGVDATDEYSCNWDPDTEQWVVTDGPDGINEVNLFPQDTGAPGNRGTIDVGSNNNSTADIARQIVDGVSAAELEYHGGELKLDENGQLMLNGDTGISAGVKDELNSIKGQPRVVPLFASVAGNGNNSQYTITRFAGVRIMNVKLTGTLSGKQVIVQPAKITVKGAIAGEGGQNSDFIYSPVWLIR
jgi:hypothetical protein